MFGKARINNGKGKGKSQERQEKCWTAAEVVMEKPIDKSKMMGSSNK